jgi:ERCC4-related helicase
MKVTPSVVSYLVGVIVGARFDIDTDLLVQRRLTALALVEVLKTTSEHIPFIRPEALTGPWNHYRLPQRAILDDFQMGICNLLVSTRTGEDGIEIPPATCVIRCVE